MAKVFWPGRNNIRHRHQPAVCGPRNTTQSGTDRLPGDPQFLRSVVGEIGLPHLFWMTAPMLRGINLLVLIPSFLFFRMADCMSSKTYTLGFSRLGEAGRVRGRVPSQRIGH